MHTFQNIAHVLDAASAAARKSNEIRNQYDAICLRARTRAARAWKLGFHFLPQCGNPRLLFRLGAYSDAKHAAIAEAKRRNASVIVLGSYPNTGKRYERINFLAVERNGRRWIRNVESVRRSVCLVICSAAACVDRIRYRIADLTAQRTKKKPAQAGFFSARCGEAMSDDLAAKLCERMRECDELCELNNDLIRSHEWTTKLRSTAWRSRSRAQRHRTGCVAGPVCPNSRSHCRH